MNIVKKKFFEEYYTILVTTLNKKENLEIQNSNKHYYLG